MRPRPTWMSLAGLAAGVLMTAAACSSASGTPAASVLGATSIPSSMATSQAVTTMAPSAMSSMAANGGSAASSLTLAEGKSSLGTFLTGANGMTLYFFAKDAPDKSNCTGQCASFWPPLTISAGGGATGPADATKGFGTITRADGSMQVTYNHMPLYYFANDKAAGDTTGQGFQGLWGVALVTGTLDTAKAGGAAPATNAPPTTAPTQAGYSY